jgi:hypothetical protein
MFFCWGSLDFSPVAMPGVVRRRPPPQLGGDEHGVIYFKRRPEWVERGRGQVMSRSDTRTVSTSRVGDKSACGLSIAQTHA